MVFSTTLFIFLFLPLFLLGYYLLPFRWRSAWILLASYAFYGWWRVDFLALIVLTSLWTDFFGRIIARSLRTKPQQARLALGLGVGLNLLTLAYFKYADFGIDSLNAIVQLLGGSGFGNANVILPIGISFYIFQASSYLIDIYRQDARPADNILDLAAYIALFPQLIAGPILRYKTLSQQFRRRSHSFAAFNEGSLRFMTGFCKKVLIADSVAPLANASFALAAPSMADAWLGTLAYSVQLYFDFSGYSDMAIGLGLMMGFRFPENFDHPYISKSISEFWRRWHISLSTWLRDYLYVPLGGNRLGRRRTYVNLLLVMLLGGLWHGAAWTFVLWGAWHGLMLALERYYHENQQGNAAQGNTTRNQLPRWLTVWQTARTMLIVMLGWVTFRAVDFGGAMAVYAGMLGLQGLAISEALAWQLSYFSLLMLGLALLLIYLSPWLRRCWQPPPSPSLSSPSMPRQTASGTSVAAVSGGVSGWLANLELLIIPLFALSVLRLAANTFSPFLYFQF